MTGMTIPLIRTEMVISFDGWVGWGSEQVVGGRIVWLGFLTLAIGPKGR